MSQITRSSLQKICATCGQANELEEELGGPSHDFILMNGGIGGQVRP